MSLLSNLKSDATIENERDSVGGVIRESGAYLSTIALAYLTKAASGAVGLVLNLKPNSGGPEIRATVYMTSGTAKGGTNYYTDKDGKKQYLPGFNLANSLSLLTVGKEIADLETEVKVVQAYSPEAKAEIPTKVDMLTELLGKEVIVGLIKQTVDKTQKDSAGVYQPTGETRDENEIDKFFRARDNMTTAEIRSQATEAVFFEQWTGKWEGVTRNKAKGAGAAGKPGAPRAAGAAGAAKKPQTSLFA